MKAFRTAFWVWCWAMVFIVASELFPNYWGTIRFSGLIFFVLWGLAWAQNDHDRHSND